MNDDFPTLRAAVVQAAPVLFDRDATIDRIEALTAAAAAQGAQLVVLNMTRITNHKGDVTSFVYDDLGRKQSMDHPDRGFWQYDYNTRGKLWHVTDARNQITTFVV